MVIRMVQPRLLLLLSSDWRSYKLRLRVWVRGQWRKRYGSNMSILLLILRLIHVLVFAHHRER